MHLSETERQHVKRFMDAWLFEPHDANEVSPHRNVYINEQRTQRVIVTAGKRVYLAKNEHLHESQCIASYQIKGSECTI